MTSERRLLMGLDDIKALTFECRECLARLTLAPDKATPETLENCPQCSNHWLTVRQQPGITRHVTGSPTLVWLQQFPKVLESQSLTADHPSGFRLLLEFQDDR